MYFKCMSPSLCCITSIQLNEQILRLFPLTQSANKIPAPLDLKIFALKKQSFDLPFDFFLAALINRGVCSGKADTVTAYRIATTEAFCTECRDGKQGTYWPTDGF